MIIYASIKEQHLDDTRSFANSAESKDDNKIKQETLKIANVLYSLNIESIPKTCVSARIPTNSASQSFASSSSSNCSKSAHSMKIGIAQINTTVGDLSGNSQLIVSAYNSLVADGAELILFPELALCGYPPRDLLFKSRFVSDIKDALESIARQIGEVPAVIGYVQDRGHRLLGVPSTMRQHGANQARSTRSDASHSYQAMMSSTKSATSNQRKAP
jgi:hypothetical protein